MPSKKSKSLKSKKLIRKSKKTIKKSIKKIRKNMKGGAMITVNVVLDPYGSAILSLQIDDITTTVADLIDRIVQEVREKRDGPDRRFKTGLIEDISNFDRTTHNYNEYFSLRIMGDRRVGIMNIRELTDHFNQSLRDAGIVDQSMLKLEPLSQPTL
jgi:hypothetical protein